MKKDETEKMYPSNTVEEIIDIFKIRKYISVRLQTFLFL